MSVDVEEGGGSPRCHLYPCSRSVLVILLLFVCLLFFGIFWSRSIFLVIIDAKSWFLAQKYVGVLMYCLMFSLASIFLSPFAPFAIATGYIWGVAYGCLVQGVAILLSSVLIFAITRLCMRERVLAWLQSEGHLKWIALLERVGSDLCEASKLNLLLCFVPMPYGVHAYVFALTQSNLLLFLVVFELGMITHTYLNVAIGATLYTSFVLGSGDTNEDDFYKVCAFGVSALGVLFGIWYGGVLTRRYMREIYGT